MKYEKQKPPASRAKDDLGWYGSKELLSSLAEGRMTHEWHGYLCY